jgi:putative membrane protein
MLRGYLPAESFDEAINSPNKATQIGLVQSGLINTGKPEGIVDQFEDILLLESVKEMCILQAKSERIKKTVFPYFYQYFTRLFLWVFLIVLPCTLVGSMGWHGIPLSIAISFVFFILEKPVLSPRIYLINDPQELHLIVFVE